VSLRDDSLTYLGHDVPEMTLQILSISDVENALDDPSRAARIAGLVGRERDEATLVVDSGDTLGPSVLGTETEGRAALALYDELDPDYCAFGNHDFDHGLDPLRTVVAEADPTWLCANLAPIDGDGPLFADEGVERWTVERVGDERIGLFGVTETDILAASGWDEEIELGDPVAAAGEAVAALQDRDVDRIVAVSHAGSADGTLRSELPLDAVLGGHTHERLAETVDGTATTKPGERGAVIARVELTDPPTADLVATDDAPAAASLVDRLRSIRSNLDLDDVVATVREPIPRARPDHFPESRIGNFVADAVRASADADVALVGGGRAGPPLSGEVTEADLYATTPMNTEMYAGPVDGETLLSAFEDGVREREGVPELTFHVSGARLRWERTADECRLVEATVDGDPVDPEATYRLASEAYSFFAPAFPSLSPDSATPVGRRWDALRSHVREAGLRTETDGRMVAVSDALADEALSLT